MVHDSSHARSWGAYVTAGIAALAIFSSQAKAKTHGETKAGDTEQKPLLVALPAPEPFVYPYSCTKPANPDQDYRCISARSATAAEESAFWAKLAFGLGIFTTGGLIGTIVLTALSVRASQRSAGAAEDAIKHARAANIAALESSHRMERAYMFIGMSKSQIEFTPYGYRIIPNIENYGKTPGFIKYVSIKFFRNEPMDGNGAYAFTDYPSDYVFSAGENTDIFGMAIYHTQPTAHVGMAIRYQDIFGEQHVSRTLLWVDSTNRRGVMNFSSPYWSEWT